MSVTSAPYYWITCDAPGCQQRCPSEDNDEYSAYRDIADAVDCARYSEWKITSDGRHYCWVNNHDAYVCTRCETYDRTPLPDYLCTTCHAKSEATS